MSRNNVTSKEKSSLMRNIFSDLYCITKLNCTSMVCFCLDARSSFCQEAKYVLMSESKRQLAYPTEMQLLSFFGQWRHIDKQ